MSVRTLIQPGKKMKKHSQAKLYSKNVWKGVSSRRLKALINTKGILRTQGRLSAITVLNMRRKK